MASLVQEDWLLNIYMAGLHMCDAALLMLPAYILQTSLRPHPELL